VQADAATNSLVIRTSPRNLEAIRNIIQNLDRPRPQVLIKVLIAEVTLDKNTKYGVEGFWENKFRVNGDAITQRHGTDFNLPTQGLATLITGDEMKAALNAFSEDGKLKVLATPRVLVLDNQTANINVGKEVPRVTNSFVNELGNTQNTITYERLGILLEVTPHINFAGLVTMEVHPEISDIAPAAEAVIISPGVTSPTFNVNSADTTVAVRTGQTVVIGGLIRESTSDTVSKVPILGDIPLIGLLFSNTVKETVQRELMIFLTPVVAYTAAQLEEMTELEKAKLKLIDDGDVEDGGNRWLERIRK
jgi:general secretion pathway protein D